MKCASIPTGGYTHPSEGKHLSSPTSTPWGCGHQWGSQWPLDQSQPAEGICGAARPPHDKPAGPGAYCVWPGAQQDRNCGPSNRIYWPWWLLHCWKCIWGRWGQQGTLLFREETLLEMKQTESCSCLVLIPTTSHYTPSPPVCPA